MTTSTRTTREIFQHTTDGPRGSIRLAVGGAIILHLLVLRAVAHLPVPLPGNAAPPAQDVISAFAVQLIVSASAEDTVVASPAIDHILAASPGENVISRAAMHAIVTVSAMEPVVAAFAAHVVVA